MSHQIAIGPEWAGTWNKPLVLVTALLGIADRAKGVALSSLEVLCWGLIAGYRPTARFIQVMMRVLDLLVVCCCYFSNLLKSTPLFSVLCIWSPNAI